MKVEIWHFRCHRHRVFVFKQREVTLLTGRNGCGKTSALLAVLWCLYGKVLHVDPSAKGKSKTCVQISLGGTFAQAAGCRRLIICRRRNPGELTLAMAGKKNGGLRGQEAQEKINCLFGQESVFTAACYLEQKSRCAFLSAGAGKMPLVSWLCFQDEKPDELARRLASSVKVQTRAHQAALAKWEAQRKAFCEMVLGSKIRVSEVVKGREAGSRLKAALQEQRRLIEEISLALGKSAAAEENVGRLTGSLRKLLGDSFGAEAAAAADEEKTSARVSGILRQRRGDLKRRQEELGRRAAEDGAKLRQAAALEKELRELIPVLAAAPRCEAWSGEEPTWQLVEQLRKEREEQGRTVEILALETALLPDLSAKDLETPEAAEEAAEKVAARLKRLRRSLEVQEGLRLAARKAELTSALAPFASSEGAGAGPAPKKGELASVAAAAERAEALSRKYRAAKTEVKKTEASLDSCRQSIRLKSRMASLEASLGLRSEKAEPDAQPVPPEEQKRRCANLARQAEGELKILKGGIQERERAARQHGRLQKTLAKQEELERRRGELTGETGGARGTPAQAAADLESKEQALRDAEAAGKIQVCPQCKTPLVSDGGTLKRAAAQGTGQSAAADTWYKGPAERQEALEEARGAVALARNVLNAATRQEALKAEAEKRAQKIEELRSRGALPFGKQEREPMTRELERLQERLQGARELGSLLSDAAQFASPESFPLLVRGEGGALSVDRSGLERLAKEAARAQEELNRARERARMAQELAEIEARLPAFGELDGFALLSDAGARSAKREKKLLEGLRVKVTAGPDPERALARLKWLERREAQKEAWARATALAGREAKTKAKAESSEGEAKAESSEGEAAGPDEADPQLLAAALEKRLAEVSLAARRLEAGQARAQKRRRELERADRELSEAESLCAALGEAEADVAPPGLKEQLSAATRAAEAIQADISRGRLVKLGHQAYEELARLDAELCEAEERLRNLLCLKRVVNRLWALFLEMAVGAVNEKMAEVLQLVFDDPIDVRLVLLTEARSARKSPAASQVEIKISYHGRDYDSVSNLSGGEGDRISLAIFLALARVLRSPILLLDESLGFMDPETREVSLAAVRAFAAETGAAVVNVQQESGSLCYDQVLDLE